jgi:hypothetical protein
MIEPNTNKDYEPYTMHSTTPGDTNIMFYILNFLICLFVEIKNPHVVVARDCPSRAR